MQIPHGRIIAIDGHDAGNVVVEVEATVVCQRCADGKGCGAGLLGGAPKDRQVNAVVIDGLQVRRGDQVSLDLSPRNLLHAAATVYGLPLLVAVVAALIAFGLGLGDLVAALFTLLGVVVGLLLARIRLRTARCLRRFTPVVVEKLQPAVDR
jgi:sigma-E factor negative regulatory protein RseC